MPSTAAPAVGQLVQRDLEVLGPGVLHGHVAAGHRRGERPGARRRSGRARSRGWSARAGRRPRCSASRCRRRRSCAPICCSIWQRSTISGSRAALSMTVVPVREHGGHQHVLGGADAREVEPDGRAGQPVRRPGRRCSRARCRARRRAWPARPCGSRAAGSRWRRRPGWRPRPGRSARSADRARRSRRGSGVPGRSRPGGPSSAGHVDRRPSPLPGRSRRCSRAGAAARP